MRGKVRGGVEDSTAGILPQILVAEVTIGLPVTDHFPSYIPITSGEKVHQVDGTSHAQDMIELS